MSRNRVAIVHLGRDKAWGERRRVESWCTLIRVGGGEPRLVPLLGSHKRAGITTDHIVRIVRRQLAPETAMWSKRAALAAIEAAEADVAIFVTLRAFDPLVAEQVPLAVLDYVDQLSVSYRDRATASGGPLRSRAFAALARRHAALEQDGPPAHVRTVTAGWKDTATLRSMWVPNIVLPEDPLSDSGADHDLVFVGNLSYPPNIAAIGRLAEYWPTLLERRPNLTVLIAGARPAGPVAGAVTKFGWTLDPDFPDARAVYARARIAVAPLPYAAGIQNKVLEAAALGRPVLASQAALAGFGPGLPLDPADDVHTFAGLLDEWLGDDQKRLAVGRALRLHVLETYGPAHWAEPVGDLLRLARR